jgi:hypothetical protein
VKREVTRSGADIRDAATGADVQRVHDGIGPLPVVSISDLLMLQDARTQGDDRKRGTGEDDSERGRSHRDASVL